MKRKVDHMNDSSTNILLKIGDFILENDIEKKAEEVKIKWKDAEENAANVIIVVRKYKVRGK